MTILLFSRRSEIFKSVLIGILSFVLMCSLSFCSRAKTENKKQTTSAVDKHSRLVILQPFSDFTKEEALEFAQKLKTQGFMCEVSDPIQFPGSSWNSKRGRYRADSLIHFLRNRTQEGDVTIGLTHKDISTTKGKYEDWGVMGLGYMPGKSCVVSSFRIRGKNKEEKFTKVVVHEFGHTRGLDHCLVKDCLMRDAEGKDHLNEEKGFCDKCAGVLTAAGYHFY